MALIDMPVGSIISWKNAAIPTGWAVCNGLSSTPDLVGKQPRGASIDGDLRVTGGAATHLHGNPNTDLRAAHNHGGSKSASVSGGGSVWVTVGSGSVAAPAAHGHSCGISIDAGDAHDHTVGDTASASLSPRHIKRVFIRRMS